MIKRCYTIKDVSDAIELLQQFLKETAYTQSEEIVNDREHLGKMIYTTMTQGFVWLAYIDKQPVGILMAPVETNHWVPKYKQLRELVWFVLPEHRKSTIGGRLFKTYCDMGEKLLEENKIEGYFTTRMASTDEVNLERRGFRLTERTYLKEKV
jgi:hypothetical protein